MLVRDHGGGNVFRYLMQEIKSSWNKSHKLEINAICTRAHI